MKPAVAQTAKVSASIRRLPRPAREVMQRIRQTVKQAVPNAVEVMSYGMPAFKFNGRILVYYAGWEHHTALYPGRIANLAFAKAIGKYRDGKGTLKFPLDQPVPYALVRKVARMRAKAILAYRTMRSA